MRIEIRQSPFGWQLTGQLIILPRGRQRVAFDRKKSILRNECRLKSSVLPFDHAVTITRTPSAQECSSCNSFSTISMRYLDSGERDARTYYSYGLVVFCDYG